MHYDLLQIVSILAYVLGFAFLESFFAAGVLCLSAVVLPNNWLKDHLTAQSLVIVIVTAIWMAAAHYWIWKTINLQSDTSIESSSMIFPPWLAAVCLLVTYTASLWFISHKLRKSNKLENSLINAAERFTVLSTLFLIADAFSICLVFMRNIG
jgi:hypothetical protein